jgi:UDP-galactose transporter B1
MRGQAWTSPVPQRLYVSTALSYLGGMASSYWALDFINFPTITLAKSCKMIPVMLTGSLLHGKKYSPVEYARMALIAVGVTLFMLPRLDAWPSGAVLAIDGGVLTGLALTVLSLAFDGYTGSTQDTFIARHRPSTQQLMFYVRLIDLHCLFGKFLHFIRVSI